MPASDNYASEIAALEKAAASGESEIMSNGERIIVRSASELMELLSYFRNKAAAGAQPQATTTLVAFDRG